MKKKFEDQMTCDNNREKISWAAMVSNKFDGSDHLMDWATNQDYLIKRNLAGGINYALLGILSEDVVDDIVPFEEVEHQQSDLTSSDECLSRDVTPTQLGFELKTDRVPFRSKLLVESESNDNKLQTYISSLLDSELPSILKKRRDVFGGFFGTMCGPLTEKVLSRMTNLTHVISVKLDGVRCMLIVEGRSYKLYFRDGSVKLLGTSFHSFESKMHCFDCELVWSDNNAWVVGLDMCYYNGQVVKSHFDERRHDMVLLLNNYKNEGFRILSQEFYSLGEFAIVDDNKDNEGLIYTPLLTPYKFGYSDDMFRWKTENETIDAHVTCQDGRLLLSVYDTTLKCMLTVGYADYDDEVPLNGVSEFDYVGDSFKFRRSRKDKSTSNSKVVFESILSHKRLSFSYLYYYHRRFRGYSIGNVSYSLYKIKTYDPLVALDRKERKKYLLYGKKGFPFPDRNRLVDNLYGHVFDFEVIHENIERKREEAKKKCGDFTAPEVMLRFEQSWMREYDFLIRQEIYEKFKNNS